MFFALTCNDMMDEVNFIERLTKPTILLKGFKRIKKEHAACLPLNTFWIDLSLEFTLKKLVKSQTILSQVGLGYIHFCGIYNKTVVQL